MTNLNKKNTRIFKMKNLFTKNYWAMKGLALLVLVVMGGSVRGQIANGFLNFGTTSSGTTATTANSGFSIIRIGSGGGNFTIQNPGQSIGYDGEIKGVAPNGGSVNSIGIASSAYGTAANTFTISFELHLSGGASGTWSFFAGNGSGMNANTATFSSTEIFTGIQWVFGASNTITTNNRQTSNWNIISGTPFAQNTAYHVWIIGNNSSSIVNYGESNDYSIAAYKYDLWINGSLIGNDLSKAQLGNSTDINSFRFYGESSAANVASIAIDNIRWYNTCVLPNTWKGTLNNNWNTAGNWSLGRVPLSSENIIITSGNPIMDVDYTLASNRILSVSNSGTLTINPTKTLTIAGTADFGANSVTLKSDATGTAAIGQITGTLSNATNITVERYIPALRKFRFLAAPVVGATAANWRNNGTNTAGIGTHITGGVGNNFDQSTTNAASAFWYNELLAGSDVTVGSGATSDPGWTAFANGNTEALTNGKGFRILVRGDRTISLDGTGSVTPTNTTLSVTGTYPANSVSIATTKTNSNTNSGFNLVGNPYPATIDWNTVTKGTDISSTYTTYNPSSGAFVAWNGTTGDASRYIASSQAFFVQQTGTTGGITIAEANKATNAAGNYFRNKLTDHLKVSMTYDSANYDAAFIHFRADAQNDFDNYDGLKFQNTGVNIASVGTDGKRYNINSLASLTKTTEMPLSVLGSVLTNFELKFEDVESFKNHELYLIDNYLNKMLLMSNGFTYPIALSTDSASVKDGRFKIVFVQKATGINLNEKNANAFILYPNPAADAIHLLLDAKNTTNENVAFEICNQLGAIIQFGNLDFTTTKDQSINIETLAQGIYFIKLQSNAQQQIIKFIK